MRPGRVHLIGDETHIAAAVSFVHRPSKGVFDEFTMVRDELLSPGYQAIRRITRTVSAIKYVFREMSKRARIGDNAGRAPSFEFPMDVFKDLWREPEAIHRFDVVDEVVDPGARAVGCQRVEMVTPEITDPSSGGQSQPLHKGLSGTFAPSTLFRSQPDFSRRSAGTAGRIPPQLILWDRSGDQLRSGSMHVFTAEHW